MNFSMKILFSLVLNHLEMKLRKKKSPRYDNIKPSGYPPPKPIDMRSITYGIRRIMIDKRVLSVEI